nr:L-ribulose-5-phosphate 4-epimerase AraD [bacterium]
DRDKGVFAIKPSGVPYEDMTVDDIVVLDLELNRVWGRLNPSSDTPTHAVFYRAFPEIGGAVHTHSTHATAFAQAGCEIPVLGTTHADYFYGPVPCARQLTREEIEQDYEAATGRTITEAFAGKNPLHTPGALAMGHGPFTWGRTPAQAVHNAVVLEEVATMASLTLSLNPTARLSADQMKKHYLRKHGPNATYGQR